MHTWSSLNNYRKADDEGILRCSNIKNLAQNSLAPKQTHRKDVGLSPMLAALRSPAGRMCGAGSLCLRDLPVGFESRNLFRDRRNGYSWQVRMMCLSLASAHVHVCLTYLWQANVCFADRSLLGVWDEQHPGPRDPFVWSSRNIIAIAAACVVRAGCQCMQLLTASACSTSAQTTYGNVPM